MNNIKQLILNECEKKGLSLAQLAALSGMTRQNLNNKFVRNSFYFEDLEKIFGALDIGIKLIDRKSGEIIES